MGDLHFVLRSAAVLAPGLPSLAALRSLAREERAYAHAPLAVPPAAALPSQERRRASAAVRLALACALDALHGCGVAPGDVDTVFATDEGTGEVCRQMLDALATTRQVSPLVFSNSVVNAPSGYFGIACGNRRSSTVVSMGLESFASGLMCAVTESHAKRQPVLFVSYDPPMTAPMDELLPVREAIANAWVIDCEQAGSSTFASFAISLGPRQAQGESVLPGWMPAAWAQHSSARGLAALGLLDAADGARMDFALGDLFVTLRRTERPAR